MAKNISLLEGKQARNFSGTKKLRTTKGATTQDWIPEDEAGDYCDFRTLEVTQNGTYRASDCDGYDKIVVDVHNGDGILIPKTIVRNGRYKAADDNADGYSVLNVKAGGVNSDYTFNWTQKSGLSIRAQRSVAVVGDTAYAIDSNSRKLMSYSGDSWQEAGPSGEREGSDSMVFEHNGELYATSEPVGSTPGYMMLQKYNGPSTGLDRIPGSEFPNPDYPERPLYRVNPRAMLSYQGKIYLLGGYMDNVRANQNKVFIWDGNSWSQETELPSAFSNDIVRTAVVYKNKIHCLSQHGIHYSYDGSSWTNEPTAPDISISWQATVSEIGGIERIHIYNQEYTNRHYSFDGKIWRPERSKRVSLQYGDLWARDGYIESAVGYILEPEVFGE